MISIRKDKWLKYKFMKSSPDLLPYLPKTYPMSQRMFWKLMAKYERVIVKPTGGSRGRSVFQITALEDDEYEIHLEDKKIKLEGKDHTYDYLKQSMGSGRFIVQRCIKRAAIGGCPFDVRVIVQRRKNSDAWIVTGKVAKVAGKGYIVSNNTRSSGQLLFIESAIRQSSINSLSAQTLISNLERIALLSVKNLAQLYPDHRMYGFDMALDHKGHVWIIEANLFPSRSHFRKLRDHTMLRQITSYKNG